MSAGLRPALLPTVASLLAVASPLAVAYKIVERTDVVRNAPIRWLQSSLRRDCADLDLTPDGLVRVPHALPPVSFDLYVGDMI